MTADDHPEEHAAVQPLPPASRADDALAPPAEHWPPSKTFPSNAIPRRSPTSTSCCALRSRRPRTSLQVELQQVSVRVRLDRELVRRGLLPSREQALAAIAAGRVRVGGQPADKPARAVAGDDLIELADDDDPGYASRGAYKLAGSPGGVRRRRRRRCASPAAAAWMPARRPAASPTCCCGRGRARSSRSTSATGS